MNPVSPTVTGDTIIVPYESGELYALATPDGRELWDNSLSIGRKTQASAIFGGIGGDPVVDGEVVFAVSSGGMIAAYGIPLGQRLWEKPVASINTPWAAGDYLFVLTTDNTLVALLKYDGRIRWSTRLASFEDEDDKKRPIFWRGPVMVDGKLAVAGSHGEMVLVSAVDGSVQSTLEIPEGVTTAPVIAGGAMMFVTRDATLYTLK
jgi:outer membrane protein assembly factor BamB